MELIDSVAGTSVGCGVGVSVGAAVGSGVGTSVGTAVGSDAGTSVGDAVGSDAGASVGIVVGCGVSAATVAVGMGEACVASLALESPPIEANTNRTAQKAAMIPTRAFLLAWNLLEVHSQ